nr:hypothetical protein [Vibrio chagasii]
MSAASVDTSPKIETERIVTQEVKRLAGSIDASFYHLVQKIVLRLKNLEVVVRLNNGSVDYEYFRA